MQLNISILSALLASLAIASPVPADAESTCAANAVTALNALTTETNNISASVENLQIDAASTEIPSIATSLGHNIQTLAAGVGLPCRTALTEAEQKEICAATEAYLNADISLVKALDSKKSILAGSVFGVTISVAARSLEAVTDTFVIATMESTPVCGSDIGQLEQTLSGDIEKLLPELQLLPPSADGY